ncbi:hypothetical protein TNCV_1285541 [Trichonephila clavipes]|uniref:Uncharacterized protein n=1 Tax=Trichonephila clavipes TaxID=2585209 RepID=A0A8X6VPP0_TRICX|nr:hypothetical protein TNCV_1285541 [Trichonephila clavipes]
MILTLLLSKTFHLLPTAALPYKEDLLNFQFTVKDYFDVTQRQRRGDMRDTTLAWLGEINEYAQDDVVIMLIGNKADAGTDRVVMFEDGERLAKILLRDKQLSPYCACLGRIIPLVSTPSANKKLITVLLSFSVQIDNGAATLNGLLHPNDYDERRLPRCIEVLLITPHSALDTSTGKRNFKNPFE